MPRDVVLHGALLEGTGTQMDKPLPVFARARRPTRRRGRVGRGARLRLPRRVGRATDQRLGGASGRGRGPHRAHRAHPPAHRGRPRRHRCRHRGLQPPCARPPRSADRRDRRGPAGRGGPRRAHPRDPPRPARPRPRRHHAPLPRLRRRPLERRDRRRAIKTGPGPDPDRSAGARRAPPPVWAARGLPCHDVHAAHRSRPRNGP